MKKSKVTSNKHRTLSVQTTSFCQPLKISESSIFYEEEEASPRSIGKQPLLQTLSKANIDCHKKPASENIFQSPSIHSNQMRSKIFNHKSPVLAENSSSQKFKRFSKILKHKYLFFSEDSEEEKKQQPQQKMLLKAHQSKIKKSKATIEHKQKQQVQLTQNNNDRKINKLPVSIEFKQRPSSGVPLNKTESLSRKRKVSFSQTGNLSLQLKHIDALCYQDRYSNIRSFRWKAFTSKYHHFRHQSISQPHEKKMKILGETLQDCICIDPWQHEQQRMKNLSDLQINVKLSNSKETQF